MDAVQIIGEGNALEDAGHFAEALERHDQALLMSPNLARAHLNRGNALLENAASLSYNAKYAPAPHNLGTYVRSGLGQEMRYRLTGAVALKADFIKAEVALSELYAELARYEDSGARFR